MEYPPFFQSFLQVFETPVKEIIRFTLGPFLQLGDLVQFQAG
jgi:hypothetical protein